MRRDLFLRRKVVHHPNHISGVHAAERPVAIARGNYFAALGIYNELRWLDEFAVVFPPRPQQISGRTGKSIANGKVYHIGDFLRLVERIDAGCDHLHADFFELLFVLCIAG